MSDLYIDDPVLVFAQWSSFYQQRGTVTAVRPHLMVRLDGDKHPMRFSPRECIRIEEFSRHVGGAE